MKLNRAAMCALCVGLSVCVVPTDAFAGAWFDVLDKDMHWLCSNYEDVFDVYIWMAPDTAGVVCAEYQFVLPVNMVTLSVQINPAVDSAEGTYEGPPGLKVCFHECQRDPVWVTKIECTFSTRYCSNFQIIAHEVGGDVRVSSCADPDSFKGAYYSEWGYMGPDCPCPANEETSWGAIKALSRQ